MDKVVAFSIRAVQFLLVLPLSTLCTATEVVLETEIEVSAQHDSNINLSENNPVSLYGDLISTQAEIKMREQNWSTYFDADLRFSEFNRAGYASDDQYLYVGGARKGERYELSLDASAIHDTTRTSEGDDSGRFSNARRQYYSITPSWSYHFSPRHLMTLRPAISTADYGDPRYTGYDYGKLYWEWTYIRNERLRYFVRANVSQYESDGRTGDYRFIGLLSSLQIPIEQRVEQTYVTNSESAGIQVGASYQWTENLSLYGLAGSAETDTDYDITTVGAECDSENPVWVPGNNGLCDLDDSSSSTRNISANMVWRQERHRLRLDYRYQTQPSSDGYLLESQQADIDWRYRFSEQGSMALSLIAGKNQALDEPANALATERSNRDYATATLNYQHQLTEHWYINAYTRYRYQDREFIPGSAEGWGGRIGVSYYPRKLQW